MDGLNSLMAWFVENEAALSGVAATVVILGFVASPLGAGVRGLVRRRSLASPEFVETQTSAMPASDIPPPSEPEADRPSIAVLPFAPASKDGDSEIFADAMTDDIITALGHVPGFFVTSSSSTFVYKQKTVDARQIGRELGVRYVVEGRVQKAGNKVRINATLVEARTGDQIWSEHFSGDLTDIFALQDEVAQSLVGQLQPELMQAEYRRGNRMPTENLDAWTLLHGARMSFLVGHGPETSKEAMRLAEAALEKDPDYAEAHGLLADAMMTRITALWSEDPEKDRQQAAFHLGRALELDPSNPYVLYSAAVGSLFAGNIELSAEQIERCCAINPNDAFAQAQKGLILAFAGRAEEALDAAILALRLSPRDPRAYWMLMDKGIALMMLERYDEAEKFTRRSIGLNNRFFWAWFAHIIILSMQGNSAEAKKAISEIRRLSPDLEWGDFEKMYLAWQSKSNDAHVALIERQIDAVRDIWPS